MLRVVRLNKEDWEEYKKIRLECLQKESQAFNSKFEDCVEYEDEYWIDRLAVKKDVYIGAKEENELVGIVNLKLEDKEEEVGTAVVQGMYVKSRVRGKGLGKKMMRELIDIAQKNKIERLRLWVRESQVVARSMYESEGFKFVEKAGEKTVIMEKVLSD